jgi:hypothetical protein
MTTKIKASNIETGAVTADKIASGAITAEKLDANAVSGALGYTPTNPVNVPSLNGYATETYVNNQISALVDSSPSTLDTLNELAAALGDDANFATTVTNQLAEKASTGKAIAMSIVFGGG